MNFHTNLTSAFCNITILQKWDILNINLVRTNTQNLTTLLNFQFRLYVEKQELRDKTNILTIITFLSLSISRRVQKHLYSWP